MRERSDLDREKVQLAAERDLHHAQVKLIASGMMNPQGRLGSDADGHTVLISDALTAEERVTFRSPWSDMTAKFRSALLWAYDEVRGSLGVLMEREQAAEAKEAVNRKEQERLQVQRERLDAALAQLASREAELAANAAVAERRKRDAEDREARANAAARTATKETQRQRAWAAIIEQTKDDKVILAADENGRILVASDGHDAVWSPAMRAALLGTPPSWPYRLSKHSEICGPIRG